MNGSNDSDQARERRLYDHPCSQIDATKCTYRENMIYLKYIRLTEIVKVF